MTFTVIEKKKDIFVTKDNVETVRNVELIILAMMSFRPCPTSVGFQWL